MLQNATFCNNFVAKKCCKILEQNKNVAKQNVANFLGRNRLLQKFNVANFLEFLNCCKTSQVANLTSGTTNCT